MKKLFVFALSMTLVLALATCTFADNTVKIGYDLGANTNYNGTNYQNSGLDVAYEYSFQNGAFGNEALGYGLGIEYQFQKQLTGTDKQFSYIPIYGLVSYDVGPVYLTGRLGYNLFTPNDAYKAGSGATGGLYYAAGVGYKFQQFTGELLYQVNNGTVDKAALDTAFALRFGYHFSNNRNESAKNTQAPATVSGSPQKTEEGVAPTNDLKRLPAPVLDFLRKVQNGAVSMADLDDMQTQLNKMPNDEMNQSGNPDVSKFLAKVKSGAVTSDDLKKMKTLLNTAPMNEQLQ